MHLDTQNVPEIIKNHLFYYMKMNRRFFASNAFLIDFGTHFGSKMETFSLLGPPFSHLNRTLGLNLAQRGSFCDFGAEPGSFLADFGTILGAILGGQEGSVGGQKWGQNGRSRWIPILDSF